MSNIKMPTKEDFKKLFFMNTVKPYKNSPLKAAETTSMNVVFQGEGKKMQCNSLAVVVGVKMGGILFSYGVVLVCIILKSASGI